MTQDCLGSLRTARERIDSVERALMNPKADFWERCSPELDAAIGFIAGIEIVLREGKVSDLHTRAELRRELESLKRDLRRVNALFANAADYYRVCADLLGMALAGYSAEGRVGTITAPAQLSVQG